MDSSYQSVKNYNNNNDLELGLNTSNIEIELAETTKSNSEEGEGETNLKSFNHQRITSNKIQQSENMLHSPDIVAKIKKYDRQTFISCCSDFWVDLFTCCTSFNYICSNNGVATSIWNGWTILLIGSIVNFFCLVPKDEYNLTRLIGLTFLQVCIIFTTK